MRGECYLSVSGVRVRAGDKGTPDQAVDTLLAPSGVTCTVIRVRNIRRDFYNLRKIIRETNLTIFGNLNQIIAI